MFAKILDMKKLLFILLLASCSKIDIPKGEYQPYEEIYIRANSEIVSKACDIVFFNTLIRDGQMNFGLGKESAKLVIPAEYVISIEKEYDNYFADAQGVVIRSRKPLTFAYDTIAYIPNKVMKEFATRAKYFIKEGEYTRLYASFHNDLYAIPITGKGYRDLQKKGGN